VQLPQPQGFHISCERKLQGKAVFLVFLTAQFKCHQHRYFTLKMHQNRWRLGLCPRPHWGSLACSPDTLDGGGKRGKKRRGDTRKKRGVPRQLILIVPPLYSASTLVYYISYLYWANVKRVANRIRQHQNRPRRTSQRYHHVILLHRYVVSRSNMQLLADTHHDQD